MLQERERDGLLPLIDRFWWIEEVEGFLEGSEEVGVMWCEQHRRSREEWRVWVVCVTVVAALY